MIDSTFKAKIQDPLVPADVAFPGFQFLYLDIKAMTEGDLSYLSGDGFKAALTLMAKSWQETPATSLPDDDRKLAAHCGFGRGPSALTEWEAVKDEALSDFTLCSDGRWYSRTLTSKALEAWESRKEQIARTKKAREARAENRKTEQDASASATTSVTEPVTSSVTDTATASVTASRLDQIRSEEIRKEEIGSDRTGSDRTGVGATSGKGGVGVEGGTGGRQRQPTQPQASGAFSKPIILSNIRVTPETANRWVKMFKNLPDIESAMRDINSGLSTVPEINRLSTMTSRLAEKNLEAAGTLIEDDCPF